MKFQDRPESEISQHSTIKDFLESNSFMSAWPQFSKLWTFDRIIICGSSLSWKSTIATLFRNHDFSGEEYEVVHRYTTRPARKWKNQSVENSNISKESFDTFKDAWYLIYWQRTMEKSQWQQRTEMYWFHSDEIMHTFKAMDWITDRKNKEFYVYSANNDYIRRMAEQQSNSTHAITNVHWIADNSLVLYVDASYETRYKRMQQREDNMLLNRPYEAQYRLSDAWDDVKKHAHIVIHNNIENIEEIQSTLDEFIVTLFWSNRNSHS